MLYEYAITVSADTSKDSPKRQRLKLTKGIIHILEVGFPYGCNNMVEVTLWEGGAQIFPHNPEETLKANGYTISASEWYELMTEPYELEFKGWSPDTTYNHTITVRIGILPREALQPGSRISNAIDKISRLLFGY